MDNSAIKINIIGKSFDKISNSVLEVDEKSIQDILRQKIPDDHRYEEKREAIKDYFKDEDVKEYLLENYLRKIDKKYAVNTAQGASKINHSKPIWTYFNGHFFYDGTVGVIEDDYDIEIRDVIALGKNNRQEVIEALADKDSGKLNLCIRLQIQSKVDGSKPYLLATMLLRDKIKLNDNIVPGSEEDLYDYLLLFWYKNKLQEAFEKGYYKTYQRFEANNERLKGTIDISRHLRLNMGQKNGKIAYSYRENTVNNYLNHMIVAAYDYFKRKYPELVESNFDNDTELKKIVESIRTECGYDIISNKVLLKENVKPIAHPYYIEYEELRQICIQILCDEGLSIWDARDRKSQGILFYIPDYWELYLEEEMKEKGVNVYSQGKTPAGETTIKIFGNSAGENFAQKTYPDYIFFDEAQQSYMVLDAKFKSGWECSLAKDDGGEAKIYNINDYDKCIRDMNSVAAHVTGIIYPTNRYPANIDSADSVKKEAAAYFSDDSIEHCISKYNTQDRFYTFPVTVPESKADTKYSDWKKEFDVQVAMAMDKIAEISEKEKARAHAAGKDI